VVGITGSYGKTSTKYYLSTILSEKFDVLMTPGSFNTPMGVVKTVRESLRPTHEVFICEMGAKYVGDIKELCQIADPRIGIISSIGAQHLETFGSIENIVSTKLELLDHLAARDGKTILNGDCSLIRDNVPPQSGVIFCGELGDADLKISDVSADERGTSFTVTPKNSEAFSVTVSLLGAHNVSNLSAAIAVALELGMTPDEIKRAARKIKSAPHRLEIKSAGRDVIIDDAYNANPAGTKAALAALALFKESTRIIVTPGMVELGEDSDSFNKALGSDAAAVCDYIFLVGSYGSEIIRSGALEAGFDENKIFIFDRVEDAINHARGVPSDAQRVLLLENDLPDNY
jgi:UDP-N-acetylmuramoyl-tripeptide--D-alanyl-D-alanine ligase